MPGFIIAATIILGLAAGGTRLLRGRPHEIQRLVLLTGMITTLLLPVVMELTAVMGLSALVSSCGAPGPGRLLPGGNIQSLFAAVWLGGAVLLGARLCWHVILALRMARRSRAMDDDEVSAVARALDLPRREVARRFRICAGIETPLVLAGLRQIVLLPAAWPRWPAGLQSSALRHEWQHVRTADAQWAVPAALLRVVLWFHPLAWWVCARWAEQCEHLADRAAASGRAAGDYARDLLSLAARAHTGAPAFATAFIPRTRTRLERRIRAVLDDSARSLPCGRIQRLLVLLVFAAAGLSLAALLARPKDSTPADLLGEARTRLAANPFPADP
ncbi:MAG: M56 family metallopeptidase [Verrucomicrobiaceae bacterium]|nr:M56 family metallopeptidase [Verrucomicrobiaceae bacterium]